ncbi:hypothetical protein FHS26_005587 [Rhizobium pisi]|nr:hypothetical protein [Rhizobium pisi]MBB3137819.1 hypothetical protein [Rhizobium pisi]RSB65880.1 hypothetical protein EFD55_25915 [Rhizobium pisi]TCA47713.1 hypothetical protein E0J16_27550 [Rhizobium pisi]
MIYCNVSPAYLNFTERLIDPTKYPPLFVDALSWHLAVRLAMPLTRDPQVRGRHKPLKQKRRSATSALTGRSQHNAQTTSILT